MKHAVPRALMLSLLCACGTTEPVNVAAPVVVEGADFAERAFAANPTLGEPLSNPWFALWGPGASGFVAGESGQSVEVTFQHVGSELIMTIDGVEYRYDEVSRPSGWYGSGGTSVFIDGGAGNAFVLRRVISGATLADTYVDLWGVLGIETPVANLPGQARYAGTMMIAGGVDPGRTFNMTLDADFDRGRLSGALSDLGGGPGTSAIDGELDRGRLRADVTYAEGAAHMAGGGPPEYSVTGEMTGAAFGWSADQLAGTVTGRVSGTAQPDKDVAGWFRAQ